MSIVIGNVGVVHDTSNVKYRNCQRRAVRLIWDLVWGRALTGAVRCGALLWCDGREGDVGSGLSAVD